MKTQPQQRHMQCPHCEAKLPAKIGMKKIPAHQKPEADLNSPNCMMSGQKFKNSYLID